MVLRGADAPAAADRSAAILALTPRTNLPPDGDDPARLPNIRRVKPGSIYWTDDVGVDDHGNPYPQYKRSSFGTWSNYDEAKADLFPLPELLVLKNGRPVKDADTWWQQRRPEILGDFLAEIYGKIPENTPRITWQVTAVNESGGTRTKTIVGHIDKSAYPEAALVINLTLTLPANVSGPVPVMVIVNRGGGDGPRPGSAPAPVALPALRHRPERRLVPRPTLRLENPPAPLPCRRFSPGAGAMPRSTLPVCSRRAWPDCPRVSLA